ncbi:hypothetical protein [Nostoc sp.]|uniref:hypothetical protein n=1 Tax=Nostoc sp. TaxID=1180 RepID=UPI002FFB9367
MSSIDASLEVLKIVILNETFDGLDIDNKTEKILEILTKIHRRIQEIDSSSVEKNKSSSRTQSDSGKNGDNIDDQQRDSLKNCENKPNSFKNDEKEETEILNSAPTDPNPKNGNDKGG